MYFSSFSENYIRFAICRAEIEFLTILRKIKNILTMAGGEPGKFVVAWFTYGFPCVFDL